MTLYTLNLPYILARSRGLMVMTFRSHRKGSEFDPRRDLFILLSMSETALAVGVVGPGTAICGWVAVLPASILAAVI